MRSLISQASALNPGADLWIVPDLNHSKWTSKIDWYLNFQIVKATRRESPRISPFLNEVLENTGLSVPNFKTELAPLLIQSQSLLPNKWVLVVDYTNDMQSWVTQIAKVWEDLQRPSLRIFLPSGQSASPLSESWFESLDFQEVTVVLDLSH